MGRMKTSRDFAQQLIYKIIDPLVRGMANMGITPNMITFSGLVLNMAACAVLIYGAMRGEAGDLSFVGWAGGIVLFAGLFDMMDGQLARVGGMSSAYGALFDSVLDRYSELVVFFGICYYLLLQGHLVGSAWAFLALIGSMMVSYVRARAEGLGIECKGGFMQRPERVVITALGAILSGAFYAIWGNVVWHIDPLPFPVFEPILLFIVPIVVVAVLANITAIGRLKHCREAMKGQ